MLLSTESDEAIILKIAKRAEKLFNAPFITFVMDVTACHSGQPLRLNELLNAQTQHFIHDIAGINNNLDRKTFKLKNNFLPRFSK